MADGHALACDVIDNENCPIIVEVLENIVTKEQELQNIVTQCIIKRKLSSKGYDFHNIVKDCTQRNGKYDELDFINTINQLERKDINNKTLRW